MKHNCPVKVDSYEKEYKNVCFRTTMYEISFFYIAFADNA